MKTDIQTTDYCSPIDNIMDEFKTNCVGKDKCELEIDISKVFDTDCKNEIKKRFSGISQYGPTKVFSLAHCN